MTAKRAIVIAAGRGRRLMPYTDTMPKCLVPVDGRSILEIQFEAFAVNGIEEVVVIRGYLGDVLEQRVASLALPVRFVDNTDWQHNNILESLFCAQHELEGEVLIGYSDIIFTPAVVRALCESPGEIALVIDQDFRDIYDGRTEHPLEEGEVADLDDRGGVRRVGKRSLPADEAWGEFIGLAKLTAIGVKWMRTAWAELCESYAGRREQPFQRAPTFRTAYLTDLLQHLIDRGHRLEPVGIRGQWREIDTVQDLDSARELLSSNQEKWK